MKGPIIIFGRRPRGPSPHGLTMFLTICASALSHVDARHISELTNPTETCAICKELYTEGIQYINQDTTKATVSQVIEDECKHDKLLKFLDTGECANILEDLYTMAVQKIEHDISPESFCQIVKSCPGEYQTENTDLLEIHKMFYYE